MDANRDPTEWDDETAEEPSNESVEPSSDETSAMPSDVRPDAREQDSLHGANVEPFADFSDALEPISDEHVENPEAGPPDYSLLAADAAAVFSASDVVPDAFAPDAQPSDPVDEGSLADVAAGQWFAAASIPATFARSVEGEPSQAPAISDHVARQGEHVPYVPSHEQPIAGSDQYLVTPGAPESSGSAPPSFEGSAYEPLGMMRPVVLVEDADRDGRILAELDAFAARMTAVGEQTAEAAVRYARWFDWTEERRLNPDLR
jgi:hypothetical protein